MNVRALIQALEALDPDLEVLMATDPDGNGFHTLGGMEVSTYLKKNRVLVSSACRDATDQQERLSPRGNSALHKSPTPRSG